MTCKFQLPTYILTLLDFVREIFGAIRVEQRPFKLLKKAISGYEIRRYTPVVMIKTHYGRGSTGEEDSSTFGRLANFIFGPGQQKDAKQQPIAMTAPVITNMKMTEANNSSTGTYYNPC